MMTRREFITLLGGAAAAWPLAAHAQPMPVIGFLNSQSPEAYTGWLRGFRQGLKDAGYVEGENLTIEYRWAHNELDRLPALASELVRRHVAVIVTSGGTLCALAAKAATTTIPIVFTVGDDPVRRGLVASLARPGGNLTGITFLAIDLSAKRLELLRELAPGTARLAVLINPAEAAVAETTLQDVETAARGFGLQVQVFRADTPDEINAAFESMGRERLDALFVGATAFFVGRHIQLAQLAAFHRIPAVYPLRHFAEGGGLISYGIKGAKPAELPVVQASKFELVINRQTAKMLGLTLPDKLIAAADEVIE
jgi:ABC-type uncharacterized transport system substrate-binding protein